MVLFGDLEFASGGEGEKGVGNKGDLLRDLEVPDYTSRFYHPSTSYSSSDGWESKWEKSEQETLSMFGEYRAGGGFDAWLWGRYTN